MKPKIFLPCSLIALCLTALFVSCKKNSEEKKSSCKIVTITDVYNNTNNVYNVTYNNDGKVSTLTSNISSAVFTYSGNTIIINKTYNGNFDERDSITLNSDGKPTNIRQYYDQAGANWNNQSFTYDGGGNLLKSEQTDESNSSPETTLFTVTNGNVVTIQTPTTTLTLEYYTNKSAQQGGYLDVATLVSYGVNLYPHKNLLKSLNDGTNITNISYDMDASGSISTITSTSGTSVETISYQYNCN